MENKPILKVYVNDNSFDLLNYARYQRVNTIEESDAVFVGGAGNPSSFLFPHENVLTSYYANRNNDLLDIKTIMRAITLKKPIIGFDRGHLLLSIISGNCDIFYCHNLPNLRHVEISDNISTEEKTLLIRTERFFIPVPRRGLSSYLLSRSSSSRPSYYQKSKDHDRLDVMNFRKGETEALLHTRLHALSFAFEINGRSQFAFIEPMIDKFMKGDHSDLVNTYEPKDLSRESQNDTPVYQHNPFNDSFIEEAIRSLSGLDTEEQIN